MGASGTGMVGRTADQWPWLAVSGVLGVIVGVVALIFPTAAILGVAWLLGVGLIVQGVLEIVAAFRAASVRWWLLVFGILTLVAGILVFVAPAVGVVFLAWALILWFLIAGINDLLAASSGSEHRGWNIALGVISILVALVLLFSPGTAVTVLALFIAFGFLFRGGADIGLALSMRRAAH